MEFDNFVIGDFNSQPAENAPKGSPKNLIKEPSFILTTLLTGTNFPTRIPYLKTNSFLGGEGTTDLLAEKVEVITPGY